MINISQREHDPAKYDDNLLKTLDLIKQLDKSSNSKVFEILKINIMVIKMIDEFYTDEELTKSKSIFLYYAINLISKAYEVIEKQPEKLSWYQEKLILLSNTYFCKNILWMDASEPLQGKVEQSIEFTVSVANLLNQILELTLRNQETNGKEFKKKITLFKNILTHLGKFIYKKSPHLKTSANKYIFPEILEYLLSLHEKFANHDPEDILFIIFEPFFYLLVAIPDVKDDSYKGEKWILPNYSQFLERLIVLTIDCQDSENKRKYIAVLKSLSKKTPFNILDLWELAVKSQSLARIELLSSLKKDLEG